MKNVCIVGYGAIGPIHAAALSYAKSAHLYAICDNDPIRLKNGLSQHSVVGYLDFDEMLLDKNIDCVHICTPHYLHFQMVKKALECGKGVVCEKPLTMTEDEFSNLLCLERSDEVCAVFQNRTNPCIKKIIELSKNGSLGSLVAVKGLLTWSRPQEYYDQDEWRGKYKTEGGGVLINQAIHTLDFISYLAGGIKSVKAIAANFSHSKIEVEDTVMAFLKTKAGVDCIFYATNCYGKSPGPEFEMVFENGVLRYQDGSLYKDDCLIESDVLADEGKVDWGNGHKNIISDYYDKNVFFTPHDAQNTMATMFAIYKSAGQNGKEIILGDE